MSKLAIDYTIDKIIKEIQSEFLLEEEIDVEYDLITKVIEQQFKSTAQGIEDGNIIMLKYLGTFKTNPKRTNALNNKLLKYGYQPNIEDRGLYLIDKGKLTLAQRDFKGKNENI